MWAALYLQSKFFHVSGFVQQLASQLGQQELHFVLLTLPVAAQTLHLTLNPGVLILQAATNGSEIGCFHYISQNNKKIRQ